MGARRAIVGGVCAALGLLLVVPVFAAPAPELLPVYDARGTGSGLGVTFGLKPSLFSQLVNSGVPFARTSLNSQGNGSASALASQAFPADLVAGTGSFPN